MEGPEAKEEVSGEQGELVFSLVLESRMREMLEREKRAAKKGHHRKLTKKDHAAIDDELKFLRFSPEAWTAAVQRRMLEAAEEAAEEKKKKDEKAVEMIEERIDAHVMTEE